MYVSQLRVGDVVSLVDFKQGEAWWKGADLLSVSKHSSNPLCGWSALFTGTTDDGRSGMFPQYFVRRRSVIPDFEVDSPSCSLVHHWFLRCFLRSKAPKMVLKKATVTQVCVQMIVQRLFNDCSTVVQRLFLFFGQEFKAEGEDELVALMRETKAEWEQYFDAHSEVRALPRAVGLTPLLRLTGPLVGGALRGLL